MQESTGLKVINWLTMPVSASVKAAARPSGKSISSRAAR